MKRLFFISLAILFLCAVMVNAAEMKKMKIAVAADSKTAEAFVSSKAARCPYYLIFDSKGKLTEVIDNPYEDASGGAGPSAANFLAQRGVTMVVAGNFGSKIINTLKNSGVTHFEFKGSVGDAVKRALEGWQ